MSDNPQACGTCPLIFNARQCSVLCERHDPNTIKIRQHERERRVWLKQSTVRVYERTTD